MSFILINRVKSNLKSKLYRKKIPISLSNNFKELNPGYYSLMLESLKKYHYTEERGFNENYLDTKHGKKSLQDTIYNRMEEVRHRIIPWLESCRPLSNLNIIEVGSGSGTGTIALAEQVKSVIALDIDSEILKVCEDRCKILHLENVEYHCMELSNYSNNNDNLDAIIFYASLEHMTLKQRITALRTAWKILPMGGMIIIVDTPNTLFFYDGHTSGLPFHHWISDELAYRYVEFNPNSIFQSEKYTNELIDLKINEFVSWGRSLSYHDFEVSFNKSIESIKILNSLSNYENEIYYIENQIFSFLRKIRFQKEPIADRYIDLMSEYKPQINPALFRPYINIILEKN